MLSFLKGISQDVQFVKRPNPNVIGGVFNTLPPLRDTDFDIADIDGDNDPDLVMTGSALFTGNSQNTVVLLNDGFGLYSESERACLPAMTAGSVDLFDADQDGDHDLLLVGAGQGWDSAAYFFRNNGAGHFIPDTSNQFRGLIDASSAVGDINGDNLPDVILTGRESTSSYNPKLYIYLNDSSTSFSPKNHNIPGVYDGDIALLDIDGDSDLDLFVSGSEGGFNGRSSKLYVNDGTGNFSPQSCGIAPMDEVAFDFGDIDGDSDMDLFISGDTAFASDYAFIYSNNGSGYFSLDTSFYAVLEGSVTMADYDGDLDLDIYYTGQVHSSQSNRILKNNGTGNFSAITTNVLATSKGHCMFYDINSDSNADLIISGYHSPNGNAQGSEVYLNNGGGALVSTRSHFEATKNGHMDVADIDGDGDLDFVSTGSPGYPQSSKTQMFLNNGNGDFTEMSNHGIMNLDGAVVFLDADGDMDQDIVVSGKQYSFDENAKLYLNDGSGSYSFHSDIMTDGVNKSAAVAGDIDNDGDQDLIISGEGPSTQGFPTFTRVYLNNGSANFTLDTSNNIVGIESGKLVLGDVDNDQDLDLFVMGYSQMKIYLNDSNGIFNLSGNTFRGIGTGDIDIADVDMDGDLDFMYLGDTTGATSTGITRLYLNDSLGNYTLDTVNNFQRYVYGSIRFADFDGDSDPDLLLVGATPHNKEMGFFINDGSGKFTRDSIMNLDMLYNAKLEFFDIDNDQDLDFVYHGLNIYHSLNTGYVFENIQCQNVLISEAATACNEYHWNRSGCSYSSSGLHSYMGVNPRGCDTLYTLNLNIIPTPNPIWLNDSTLGVDTTANSYQWVKCDSAYSSINGATGSSYTPVSNGNYAVITNNGICTDTSACIQVRGISLEEHEFASEINVYPIPTKEELFIKGLQKESKYQIFDLRGRLIQKGTAAPGLPIPISIKKAGIYIIQLQLEGRHLESRCISVSRP